MELPYSNLQIQHWNPGATMPLTLPVHVICNTSDEEIYENIRINSRRPGKWVNIEKAHDGIAVLCGSGPSLEDHLEEIKEWQSKGAKVFAMNGAASYLHTFGIVPDYQVIIDARKETADLVGPAKEHLFGSQVHPECFEKMPTARVWHLQIGNIEDHFPEYDDGYVLIGGAASVGNTATCLAYAMGYRNLQIYGYDSSFRDDKSHAFHQKMNDGDPRAWVKFCGKDYLTSLTMKLQAEKFQATARALKHGGCHIEVHGTGLLPDMFNTPKVFMTEKEKYERMYAQDDYRLYSPGEQIVDLFIEVAKPSGKVIDFGCGLGRSGLKMKENGLDPFLIDFVDNSRELGAKTLPFIQHDLTNPILVKADYGFCTDVMEHIPPDDVETVITNIMSSAKNVFFQICTTIENCGELIGQELHLTVEDHQWWKNKFLSMGYTVSWEKRIDEQYESLFLVHSTT